jgi:hypothetical protein
VSIKHFVATGFVSIFATAVTLAGCSGDSTSDTGGDEASDNAGAVTAHGCTPLTNAKWQGTPYYNQAYDYTTIVSAAADGSTIVNNNGAYDATDYCNAQIRARRQATHHIKLLDATSTSLNPYYALASGGVVPTYRRSTNLDTTPDVTVSSQTCAWCKAAADAAVGNHAVYGNCPDDNSEGFCGFTPSSTMTVKQAIDNCFSMFENEKGASAGHKGALVVWDTARPISCVMGVTTVSGVKKGGITVMYGWPDKNQPNGANCKLSTACTSGKCFNGRCVGAPGATCPANDSLNCSKHPEDVALCVSKNAACINAAGTANGTCTSGICR